MIITKIFTLLEVKLLIELLCICCGWLKLSIIHKCAYTCKHTHLQAYLAEFNEFWEELKAKNVGIFGICAEPQNLVDRTMTEWNLHYKVRDRI